MALLELTKDDINGHIKNLVDKLEKTQWNKHKVSPELLYGPIINREGLREMKMEKGFYTTKTSGSTGEPVTIEKTYGDFIWTSACNIREIRWRKWDVTKNVAIIKTTLNEGKFDTWGIPPNVEPVQGVCYTNSYKPISELQKWLEEVNPHYINCFPSIFKQIDTSKISNFIDWKGTGEMGGTMYSTEECGVIAIQCPDNPKVMHVMENIHVDVDEKGAIIVTNMVNPYIKKYKHGDHIVLGECNCGRGLQTITEIKGRVRNMFTLPNGDKKWPLIGSLKFESFGIKRFKAIQTTLNELELQIISEPLNEKEQELKDIVIESLGLPINVTITYVDDFPNYKFEEFVSLV